MDNQVVRDAVGRDLLTQEVEKLNKNIENLTKAIEQYTVLLTTLIAANNQPRSPYQLEWGKGAHWSMDGANSQGLFACERCSRCCDYDDCYFDENWVCICCIDGNHNESR